MKSLRLRLWLVAVFVSLFASTLVLLPTQQAQALSGNEFKADRIIDDFVFYRSTPTMSVTEIQNFLNSKVPTCDTNGTQIYTGSQTRAQYSATKGYSPPFTCLKDYTASTVAKSAETGLCNGFSAGSSSAATMIYNVAVSCGVSAKVLLVTLQKEQSLITDDWPWPTQYQKAMGYGCPDTAPCDSQYYGLFNQVYNAARQMKRYAKNPELFNYAKGRKSFIQYQANNPSCSGSYVTPQSAATAALYNYTPYQPNAAALANLYGTGDACSAYGNRNFWRMYRDWFGQTYADDTDVAHPNGTLVSDANGIYLIQDGARSFFRYPQVIDSYRYNWARIKKASAGDKNLPWGPELDRPAPGTLFKVSGSPNNYVMDYDNDGYLKKRSVTDTAWQQLGYKGLKVMTLPSYYGSIIPTFSTPLTTPQHPSGTIVLFYGIPAVFMIDHGQLRAFQNELAMHSNNYDMYLLKGGTQNDSWLPRGSNIQPRDGTIVKTASGIVVIDHDDSGSMSRPFGPWDCYADRLHYSAADWVVGYESLQIPARVGPLFTC